MIIVNKLLVKSIFYRVYSSIITYFISYFVTGSIALSASIGILELIFKIFSYYAFDFGWNLLSLKKIKPCVIFLTGLSGSGKSTIAKELSNKIKVGGNQVVILDGDDIRSVSNKKGFDEDTIKSHNLNVAYMASLFEKQGVITIVSLISPFQETRDKMKSLPNNVVEVYISTPVEECAKRDVKGLYKRIESGEIKDFVGVHINYEKPLNPDIEIDTTNMDIKDAVRKIYERL